MNASSTMAVVQATSILTTPLLMTYSTTSVSALRSILCANLSKAVSPTGTANLHFRLSPYVLPPAPILASCISSGITWADWSRALGGKAFQLHITNSAITIQTGLNDLPVTVWTAPSEETPVATPQSQIEHRQVDAVAKRRFLVRPTPGRAAAPSVVRIPQLAAIKDRKPSKLSQSFSPFEDTDDEGAESDMDASEISRPSSRLSTFSFASSVSSDGSMTSVSTTSSPASMKPKPAPWTSQPLEAELEPVVTPDHSKKTSVAYLYQGGCTRVMTGGVMLGKAPAATPSASKPIPAWRRRA